MKQVPSVQVLFAKNAKRTTDFRHTTHSKAANPCLTCEDAFGSFAPIDAGCFANSD